MATLHNLPRLPRYVIAGRTHPKVLHRDGEAYRDASSSRRGRRRRGFGVLRRRVTGHPPLTALVQSARVVVLPYDSTEQVTSGVLVDAIAAAGRSWRPRSRTPSSCSRSGAGIVVGHDDPEALVRPAHRLLTEPRVADGWPPSPRGWPHRWPGQWSPRRIAIWRDGCSLSARRLGVNRPPCPTGIRSPVADDRRSRHFEHACYDRARPEHGYGTDDMARVLVVAPASPATGKSTALPAWPCGSSTMRSPTRGPCRNRMDRRRPVGGRTLSQDCWGRCIRGLELLRRTATSLWSAGGHQSVRTCRAGASPCPGRWRMRRWGLPKSSPSTRTSVARALLIDCAIRCRKTRRRCRWPWPEPRLRYANAVSPRR